VDRSSPASGPALCIPLGWHQPCGRSPRRRRVEPTRRLAQYRRPATAAPWPWAKL